VAADLKAGTFKALFNSNPRAPYILAGTVQMMIHGQPALTLHAGDPFLMPPRTPHNAVDVGPGTGQLLSAYIVETGHHPAGQGTGELLVQALGFGAGAMLCDAEGGEGGEGPGDDEVRLGHPGAGDAEQGQRAEGHLGAAATAGQAPTGSRPCGRRGTRIITADGE
jgi:hypothetical protein